MIFVFGSNLSGHHGMGAAAFAMKYHGARYGQGIGLQGQSYGIPTKSWNVRDSLTLEEVEKHVKDFLKFAEDNIRMTFQVTRIGCGLAGFRDDEIAPLFEDAPNNCFFDTAWKLYLPENFEYWGTY